MLVYQSDKRRKACSACVKAKRRCDLRLPGCTRCGIRKLVCQYELTNGSHQAAENSSIVKNLSSLDVTICLTKYPQQTFQVPGSTNFALVEKSNSPYASFDFPELAPFRNDQLDYCVLQFRNCLSALVRHSQNFFIHSSSYQEDPPIIYQDFLSFTALYFQKTSSNQTTIYRMLDDKVSALMKASLSNWSADDSLLRIQALLVYQIIRLLDSDARQRANAERDFAHLESWTIQLHQTYVTSLAEMIWESPYRQWVLLESIRRTIVISVVIKGIYAIIKDGVCDVGPFIAQLPMSSNSAAWNMSETHWWQAVASPQTSLLTYADFVTEWNEGKIAEVDVYAKLMLVACPHANGTIAFLEEA